MTRAPAIPPSATWYAISFFGLPIPHTTWHPLLVILATTDRLSSGIPRKRHHLRARLDALYFYLFGLSREDAAYVLDTLPIVRRQDEAAFGTYRTRDLILAYVNALATGDTQTVVAM